ncbi:hypothetical protein Efla_002015 [Eimeria flavescens]
MEFAASSLSSVAGSPDEARSSNGDNNCRDSPVYADFSGDNTEEMIISCSESEAWHPSSVSSLANQGGAPGPSYPPTSGEFASFPSCSNTSSSAVLPQQQGLAVPASPPERVDAACKAREKQESPWIVVNALKREVFATAALLRALRMHAAAHTRGVSAASQQQLAAAVAPLVRSFELLSERLAAAEAAKEPPPVELQEQHIHPFLFVLAQQQLQQRQQQGLSKQQQLLQQSCMRALASAVLRCTCEPELPIATQSKPQHFSCCISGLSPPAQRMVDGNSVFMTPSLFCVRVSLEQLLSIGLAHCHSAAGRRCLHALILALTNCVLQAAQRLLSATTQPTAHNAAAAAAVAALASEAYGGAFFAPSSPAAEEELLLLQCLDLLSNSLLGPAGHVFSDTCVARTLQCCMAVSLLPRASPLLRNSAAARATSIARHLFASERLLLLAQQQQQQQQETAQQSEDASGQHENEEEQAQQQQAASPPHFMARLRSGLALRSMEGGRLPLSRSTAVRQPPARLSSSGASSSAVGNSSSGSSDGSKHSGLPPFLPVPDAGASPAVSDGPAHASSKQPVESVHVGSPPAAAASVAAGSAARDSARPEGLPGVDRDFESIMGNHGKEKGAALETRLLCLRLLCVALEAGKESICRFPSLLRPLQAQVLPAVLHQDPRSAPLLLLSLTLRALADFIVFLRPYIKDQMERCLYQLLRLSISTAGGPPKTVFASEAQEIALDMLRELCSEDSFGLELLLNFDCDIRRSNIFGVLLTLLMQLAAPRIPALRGTYRFADCGTEGSHALLSDAAFHSPRIRTAAPPSATDLEAANSSQQQQTPPATTPSPVNSNQSAEASRPHHLSAFHLRRAPQKGPPKTVRSTGDGSSTTFVGPSPENLATDAAGVTRPAGLSTVNRLALAAILRLISSLANSLDSMKRSGGSRQQGQLQEEEQKAQLDAESAASYFLRIQHRQSVAQRRRNKALLARGAAAFNTNSKDAIQHLEELGLVPTPATPRSVALFLKETKGLDLRSVGIYLSANKPWNAQVLREFVGLFVFGGVGLVAALRDFLRTFRLPGESQQIERVMEAFADEYFRQQPLVNCPHNDKLASASTVPSGAAVEAPASTGETKQGSAETKEPPELSMWRWVADEGFYCSSVSSTGEAVADGGRLKENEKGGDALTQQLSKYSSSQPPHGYVLMVHKDTVFVLSYSIIMLNTDQHNSQVRSKMRVEDFVKNNRGINGGSDLPAFFLQNIYISIRHQEIKLKEAALPAAPSPQQAAGQKADPAAREQQPPDLFDILADGWTPAEGAGLGWAAFASPYGGASGVNGSDAAKDYVRLRDISASLAESSSSTQASNGCALLAEGLEYEMFKSLWSSGCLSVLRGAFEASLDMRQLEEILCGCLSLARVAASLEEVLALNVIVAELCSYFVYSVPAHSQLVLPPIMYLVRRSGAFLREEGWGAVLEVLLRLHALDLLPPALMGLDDFEGSGGAALHSLCNLAPPPFVAPASRRDRGGARKGGGWLGDLTSILFALGDSDDESDGEDGGGVHGQLMAWPEEVNYACDGLCVLRASTDFVLLPSTLAMGLRAESELADASISYLTNAQALPTPQQQPPPAVSDPVGAKQQPSASRSADEQQEQRQQSITASPVAPVSTAGLPEDEETAAAIAPYLRLKAVLAHGIRVDLAVAELFRQVEPNSSLSIAVILLVHILLGFPSLRQNPGALVGAQQKQQAPLVQSAVSSQDRAAYAGDGASSAAASTIASVVSSSGGHSEGPPTLQGPEEMVPSSVSIAEVSMLSSYVVDLQRQRCDADSPRGSIISSSSGAPAAANSVGITSAQCSNMLHFNLPPPVWSPLRGGTIPPLLSYREFTDRLFCLEVLGALMLSELTPGSFSLIPSKDYGTALLQKSPWILCAVYLDAFLRRYAIGSAAAGVPNPLEAVGLANSIDQQRQQQATTTPAAGATDGSDSSPVWARAMLAACGTDPLAQTTVQSVCSVFQAIGSRRLVETPASLPHWELLFIERLVVTILRICLRLLSDEDSLLLPVYERSDVSRTAASETAGSAAACQVAIHLLQLLTLLHPNVFCMHVQRIAQSAIILVSRLNLRACSSPLLIQVLLALYQRLVPLPAFAPTSPLPQQLVQHQQQQELPRRVLGSLSVWIGDPEALALLVLQHRNHYQMLLQTLMAFCIYTPPSPHTASSTVESRAEGEAQGKQQSQQPGKSEGMSGVAPYAANCTSLALLAALVSSIGEALQAKADVVVTRLAAAASSLGGAASGNSLNWRTRLDCQAMWLQAMQVLAIVCSFGARAVKVKALAVFQQMLIRGSVRKSAGEVHSSAEETGGAGGSVQASGAAVAGTDAAAAAAAEYWANAAEDPYTWRLCLQLVVFPLLSFRFDYPYSPPTPGDAPPPPPQQHQQQNGVGGGDSAYSIVTGLEAGMQQRDPNMTLPWMALPTRRRLTPEVAITTLGLDEVYQRKAAAASLACRLFLTKMDQLLRPFSPKGFYVDFAPQQTPADGASDVPGPQELHPGGIEGLIPPLTQLVQLLVAEAKQAPLIYRDAFLESMKNTLLVVLTCPAVAATPIPSDIKTPISAADIMPMLLSEQQRRSHQPGNMEGGEERQKGGEAAQDSAKADALLAALSCLSASQRLVVSACSHFISVSFPGVVQDLLLILPTPHPPPPQGEKDQASRMAPESDEDAAGAFQEPQGDREEESPDVSGNGSQLNAAHSCGDTEEAVTENSGAGVTVE